MKNIKLEEVKEIVTEAVNNNLKNILFVSKTCDHFEIVKWFEENPKYKEVRINPAEMWDEDRGGILRKCENTCCIYDFVLDSLNNENSILLLNYFGDKSYHRTDKVFDIISRREYTNIFPNGQEVKHDLSKLKLVIAVTSPSGSFSLNTNYYECFDEVYIMDK